jgi:hypothetical protein
LSATVIYELESIENAFNIKNKKERIEYIYDRAYDFIVGNYVDTNFCEFINDQCICQRNKNSLRKNGCCGNCKHLVNKKCNINALACKFYFCPYIHRNKKPIKIYHVNFVNCYFSYRQKIIASNSIFRSREKVLKDLYGNSLILRFLRNVFGFC